jgi:hypothetical protein
MKSLLTLLAIGVLSAGLGAQQFPAPEIWGEPAGELAELEPGYERIFDGRTTGGWTMAGPGGFMLLPDGSMQAYGTLGLFWYTRAQYSDFVLKLDWKARKPTSNSGVFIRFRDPGDNNRIAANEGYEIQILDETTPTHRTGSVYTHSPSTSVPTKPNGQWNELEIIAVGQHYTVLVNGVKVNEYEGSRSVAGHLGVQTHGDWNEIWFRNIRIKRLEDPAPEAQPAATG